MTWSDKEKLRIIIILTIVIAKSCSLKQHHPSRILTMSQAYEPLEMSCIITDLNWLNLHQNIKQVIMLQKNISSFYDSLYATVEMVLSFNS